MLREDDARMLLNWWLAIGISRLANNNSCRGVLELPERDPAIDPSSSTVTKSHPEHHFESHGEYDDNDQCSSCQTRVIAT